MSTPARAPPALRHEAVARAEAEIHPVADQDTLGALMQTGLGEPADGTVEELEELREAAAAQDISKSSLLMNTLTPRQARPRQSNIFLLMRIGLVSLFSSGTFTT